MRAAGFVYINSTHDIDGTLAELDAIDRVLKPDGVILATLAS